MEKILRLQSSRLDFTLTVTTSVMLLCQLTCQSADIMASLCGYLSRMKNCSRHADLFVRLFARAIKVRYPHPKCENFNTLLHFSHLLL